MNWVEMGKRSKCKCSWYSNFYENHHEAAMTTKPLKQAKTVNTYPLLILLQFKYNNIHEVKGISNVRHFLELYDQKSRCHISENDSASQWDHREGEALLHEGQTILSHIHWSRAWPLSSFPFSLDSWKNWVEEPNHLTLNPKHTENA